MNLETKQVFPEDCPVGCSRDFRNVFYRATSNHVEAIVLAKVFCRKCGFCIWVADLSLAPFGFIVSVKPKNEDDEVPCNLCGSLVKLMRYARSQNTEYCFLLSMKCNQCRNVEYEMNNLAKELIMSNEPQD